MGEEGGATPCHFILERQCLQVSGKWMNAPALTVMSLLGHGMRHHTDSSVSYMSTGGDLQPLLDADSQLTATLQDNSHSQLALQCTVQVCRCVLTEGLEDRYCC